MIEDWPADPLIDIHIELLPEFGFTVQNEPVYGPGSVFQGIVHLKLKEVPVAADKIILTFRGAENATAIHNGTYFIVPLLKNTFFGMQQSLWQRTREDCLLTETEYHFPFTIQMPMTQFPPSLEHKLYQCKFILTAKLIRSTFTLPTVMAQKEINYMPFIETSLLKKPVITTKNNTKLFVTVKLHSLEYVPGDTIPITITCYSSPACGPFFLQSNKAKRDQPAAVSSVLIELCETVGLVHRQALSTKRIVASHLYRTCQITAACIGSEYHVQLTLPIHLTPTINYSRIIKISYTLSVKVKSRLGPFHSSTTNVDLPLKIGTLGYGIRASQDLQVCYVESPSNSPRFLRSLQYEEALPLYEPVRLPSYQS
ncbi:hypothetical protein CU097_008433 [Rhizopus azygosporus]|uniref:Arrestin C-terminal-like domain-containing protein n=1 Tax=Rhizopus azygosporus TaxID=86630 RepID=A0A367J4H5_RHIAZ|nr:hypothetical protein CU097_008433 [Rhizopus azygosporus]